MGQEEDRKYIEALEGEVSESRSKTAQLSTALSHSAYEGKEGGNLIEFQLDTAEMLGKIEHFLRGDYIASDEEGNEIWARPMKKILNKDGKTFKKDNQGKFIEVLDTDLILFNEYGVNSIMLIIGNYLDKNTVLSTYDEMRINEILADLGDELANFIFCNYEVMGMDTSFKKTRYQLTVLTILHSVESAYRRALRGQTREDLNSAKILLNTEAMGQRPYPNMNQKKKFNLFKPGTWT